MTTLDRPTVGNLLVPYMVDAARQPIDFKALDADHVTRCARQQRCGICGDKIRRGPFAFVGPDDRRRCFADPWMHQRCAELAMAQCPFLRGDRDWRGRADRRNELLQRYSAGMVLYLAPRASAHRDENYPDHWHFEAIGAWRARSHR